MRGNVSTPVPLSRPPLERMLFIHEELKRGAFVNCTKLAGRLEVSPKTIMRDLAFMRELPGGGLELSLHLGDLEEIAAWVLSWGSHAEAFAPATDIGGHCEHADRVLSPGG